LTDDKKGLPRDLGCNESQPVPEHRTATKERQMAYAGQTIENPISGERITFRRTAADTDGEVLTFDLELSPDGNVPGMHVHPTQEERFEVVDGTMRFRRGFRKVIAKPGDVVVVPPRVRHKFQNGGDEEARVRVEVRPALRMEELLETTVDLAKEGRTNSKGMPKPLDLALFVHEFKDEVNGPFAPGWVQRMALAPLAWIARKRGHGARYVPRPATA
jgi:mannose-6-phosphate isomerase-like protein (cupin superfamily)